MPSPTEYDVAQFYRLIGVDVQEAPLAEVPWDDLEEAAPNPYAKMFKIDDDRKDAAKKGYVDTDNQSFQDARSIAVAVAYALTLLNKKKFFIRDQKGIVFSPKDIERLIANSFIGYVVVDTNDGELYADGSAGFVDDWGYELHRNYSRVLNFRTLDKKLPNVSVKAVKGRTGNGWEVTVDKSASDYRKEALAEVEKAAERLAKNGVFPRDEVATGYVSEVPGIEDLRKKYYAMGKKDVGVTS